MNIPIHQQPSPFRYLWLIALLGLPALGWYGALDDFSSMQVDGSITTAGLIYGTARGINALVSILQGTELNVPFLTFSIGQVLDPVNDLIERFSNVILLALGSLALQKILLAVVSHTMFNILLSVVAVFTGLSIFLGSPKALSALLRIFLVIAFFRFSLGLVVMGNGWVDSTFLDEDDQQRHVAMENFQGKLRQIETASKGEAQAEEQLARNQRGVIKLKGDRRKSQQELDVLDARIKGASKELKRLSNAAGGVCQYTDIFGTCPENVIKSKQALNSLEAKRGPIVSHLATIEEAIEILKERSDCIKKHRRGEKCSVWEYLPDAPNPSAIRQELNEVNDSVSDFAENCINLLMSLLLKTVAIPLLFLYLLLKIIRINWARI
jgi:hypothetical protein